ncbi:MAG: cysteine hydrolase [Alphaproteobacteria bacterium]|nr:cysteine hydrolase [Alphaproteobacteria bacterium]
MFTREEIDAIPLAGDVRIRERPVDPKSTALLLIDLQNMEWQRGKRKPEGGYLYDRMEQHVVPNAKRLLTAARELGIEPIYTVIESYTVDGRDRSVDHKISGIFAAKGSWEAQMIPDLAPLENEIVIPKTASGIFNCTNIEYVLRNLMIESVIAIGIVTDQCVEGAVRDGCDRGFFMTLVGDACATHTQERHDATLRALKGYCRQRTTDQLLAELYGQRRAAALRA